MSTPARAAGLLAATALTFVLSSGPAWADEPASAAWPDGEGRSLLDTLVLFGGGTVGLFVLIALFALLTARNNYVPPPPTTDLEPAAGNSAAHH